MPHTFTAQPFIARRAELSLLERAYESADSAFIPIYGRRRVGKSELILHFMRGKPGVYHLGKQASGPLQIRELLTEAAVALGEPLFANLAAESWKTALIALVDRWRGPGKLVLALDEFQWTAGASPELPSVLQELWDRGWRQNGKVLLILCGSYVGFMEREVLGRKSPLFGRRTAQILLRPFGFADAAAFHPSLSIDERSRIYFICGGIPTYLKCFRTQDSVETNIADNILTEFGPLHREPDFLLREELREVEAYYGVLLAVAAGHGTTRAIAQQTGIGERSLHYYLKQLVELGYLVPRHPLTGARPVARHVRYSLEDPLLRFWFRFVFPNTSFIMQMGPRRALADRIRPDLPAFYGGGFERLCREALPLLYQAEGVQATFQVGKYWDRDVQIDVVGIRDDGRVDLGECKWGRVRSTLKVAAELERKVESFPNRRGSSVVRRVFTAKPASARHRTTDIRWHSLPELYRLAGVSGR